VIVTVRISIGSNRNLKEQH